MSDEDKRTSTSSIDSDNDHHERQLDACDILEEALSSDPREVFSITLNARYLNFVGVSLSMNPTTFLSKSDVEDFLAYKKANASMMFVYME